VPVLSSRMVFLQTSQLMLIGHLVVSNMKAQKTFVAYGGFN
jgi:hypothetical protein